MTEIDAAILLALEELEAFPDLPGVPFFVYDPDGTGEIMHAVESAELKGTFRALRQHALECYPYAARLVELGRVFVEARLEEDRRLMRGSR